MKQILINYELLKREDFIHCDQLFKIRQEHLNSKTEELKEIVKEIQELKTENQ